MRLPISSIVTTTLLSLTTLSLARTIPASMETRQDPDHYVLDYRVFGATGCFDKNWGVGTLTASELGVCFPFYDNDTPPSGVQAVNLTNIIGGCSCKFPFSPFSLSPLVPSLPCRSVECTFVYACTGFQSEFFFSCPLFLSCSASPAPGLPCIVVGEISLVKAPSAMIDWVGQMGKTIVKGCRGGPN